MTRKNVLHPQKGQMKNWNYNKNLKTKANIKCVQYTSRYPASGVILDKCYQHMLQPFLSHLLQRYDLSVTHCTHSMFM
jgi:hypothetical protein